LGNPEIYGQVIYFNLGRFGSKKPLPGDFKEKRWEKRNAPLGFL